MPTRFPEPVVSMRTPLPAVVDEIEGAIRGYLAIWGDPEHRDSYGTWFDRERPPEMALDNGMHRRPILYEHAQDGVIRTEIVGVIDAVSFDDTGIAYEGHLDRSSPFFERIVAELRGSELKTSSATMNHTADFYDDGAMRVWILGELSLTKDPAEERMPPSELVRSAGGTRDASRADDSALFSQTSRPPLRGQGEPIMPRTLDELLNPEAGDVTVEELVAALLQAYPIEEVQAVITQMQPPPPDAGMNNGNGTPAALSAAYWQQVRAELDRRAAARGQTDQLAALQRQMADMQALLQQRQAAPPVPDNARHMPPPRTGAPALAVTDLRTAHLSASDMAFGYEVLRSKGKRASDDYLKALAMKLAKAAEKGEPAADHVTVRSAFPLLHLRANEIMASDIAGQGDEWVTVFYSNDLWERARQERIFSALIAKGIMELEVPQGAESIEVPLEGSDPIWRTTAQASDVDVTNRPEITVRPSIVGTDRVAVSPGEISASVIWNTTFEEDSIINVAQQINRQMSESAEDIIEYVMLNGDTATGDSTNINLIDGTPGTGLDRPAYLVTNGFLKLALVTNTANARDAGTLEDTDFLATQALLPDELLANDDRQVFISDVRTFSKAREIASFKTRDVYSDPTLEGGKVQRPWGIDYLKSGQMALANSAGKIPAAGGTLGRLLIVYAPYWALVWKRRVTVETDRDILSAANIVVARMRLALRARSNEASAVSYNITV